jgi:hypothetical protein
MLTILQKIGGRVKYLVMVLDCLLVVANKAFHLGLGNEEWTLVLSIQAGALGLDSLEGGIHKIFGNGSAPSDPTTPVTPPTK